MAESQNHGFQFEKFILENLLGEIKNKFYENSIYTNEWDFPPVSIKSFKYEGNNPTIEFGSIDRIFNINDNYILFLVGYIQNGNLKEPVFSDILYISKKEHLYLKGNLSIETIKTLNNNLRNFKEGYHIEARKWAKEQKRVFNNETLFDLRFKIDSKNQRRIQVALKLKDLYFNREFLFKNRYSIPIIESKERKRSNKE